VLIKSGQFPALTTVFKLFPFEEWECKLLACVAAVRFLAHQMGNDAELTAFVCNHLAQGNVPPPQMPPITNHPDGWTSIVALFAACQRDWGDRPDEFPIRLDAGLRSADEVERDVAFEDTLADLSDGQIDQVAALAALEWNRTVVPALIGDHRYGSFLVADYRRITPESLQRDEYMVIRGLNRVRTLAPVWILQSAEQRVDEWPGAGTSPIFTQHVPDQWRWMWELLQEPEWPDNFRTNCKLVFSEKLTAACAASKSRDNAYYAGKVD
jgi:hypothetical protein